MSLGLKGLIRTYHVVYFLWSFIWSFVNLLDCIENEQIHSY